MVANKHLNANSLDYADGVLTSSTNPAISGLIPYEQMTADTIYNAVAVSDWNASGIGEYPSTMLLLAATSKGLWVTWVGPNAQWNTMFTMTSATTLPYGGDNATAPIPGCNIPLAMSLQLQNMGQPDVSMIYIPYENIPSTSFLPLTLYKVNTFNGVSSTNWFVQIQMSDGQVNVNIQEPYTSNFQDNTTAISVVPYNASLSGNNLNVLATSTYYSNPNVTGGATSTQPEITSSFDNTVLNFTVLPATSTEFAFVGSTYYSMAQQGVTITLTPE